MFAVCIPLLAAPAQSDRLVWKLNIDHYIIFQRLTPAGVLIVSTESALLGVDTATGHVVWTRADIPNLLPQLTQQTPTIGTAAEPPAIARVSLSFLWGTPDAIVTRDSADSRAWIDVIDARTGENRWSSDALPIEDVRGHFQLPDGALLFYGRSGSGGGREDGLHRS